MQKAGAETVRARHGVASETRPPSLGELIRREWKALREDPAGERFRNHHRRLREPEARKLRLLSLVLGPLLIAIGVVMLFIPGPGMIFIVLGLALVCGQSSRLAGWLDRTEPRARRAAARVKDRWKALRPRP